MFVGESSSSSIKDLEFYICREIFFFFHKGSGI